jgi:hypothetical protein
MLRSVLVLGAAIASPAALHAQTPIATSDGAPLYRADAFVGIRPLSHARAATIGPVIGPSGDRASADRVYADDYAYSPRVAGKSPTAVDYQLAQDGLHGSVGYICLSDIAPQAPHEAAVFAGSDLGRMVGASLKFPLK